jgi:CheY-like chemotaxis protein
MAKEILIADSDKGDQEVFHRIFETADYELAFADNGEDALLKIKLFKPDLVIAGAGLKEKSGLELCETLKNDPEFKHIPFILLTGMFEDVPERDRRRVGANGIISKPLREAEIQALVGQLLEDKMPGIATKKPLEEENGWTSLPKGKTGFDEKRAFTLEGLEEDEEEIVELVDIVEEPEPKMSIDDFIASGKAEPAGDIPPLDSWDRIFEEEKQAEGIPSEEVFDFHLAAKMDTGPEVDLKMEPKTRPEEVFDFPLGRESESEPKVDLKMKQEATAEEELFEKIELEEILEKVERLQPIIEKEWPKDLEIDRKIDEALPLAGEEPPEKWLDLAGFEAALKTEVMAEGKVEAKVEPAEEKFEPFSFEEPKERVSLESSPLSLEMPPEEEFFGKLPEGELSIDQFLKETLPKEEPLEGIIEEDLLEEKLPEKELPINLIEDELEEDEIKFIEEVLRGDEISFVQEFLEERIEEPLERKEEKIEIFPELEPPALIQELQPPDSLEEVEAPRFVQEVQAPGFPREVETPKRFLEEAPPQARLFDRQMEEVMGKGVQEMMEGFITKVLPEMTQNILNLTVERIEKMVKEILPDLAEKAIQEEIRRLKKGDKD